MDAKERLNALEIAHQNELREREFYLRNAQRTKNPLGKAMFQQIGDEELGHYERIKELHRRWESTGAWTETVPLKVKSTQAKDILLTLLKKAEEIPEGDADDLEAIRNAIDFEANGAQHYAKLRDYITAPQEKNFFDLLAKIETAHYLSLKDSEDFLTNPIFWYQKRNVRNLRVRKKSSHISCRCSGKENYSFFSREVL